MTRTQQFLINALTALAVVSGGPAAAQAQTAPPEEYVPLITGKTPDGQDMRFVGYRDSRWGMSLTNEEGSPSIVASGIQWTYFSQKATKPSTVTPSVTLTDLPSCDDGKRMDYSELIALLKEHGMTGFGQGSDMYDLADNYKRREFTRNVHTHVLFGSNRDDLQNPWALVDAGSSNTPGSCVNYHGVDFNAKMKKVGGPRDLEI